MAINHNAIRGTLKWLTIAIFLVALGHKLYQIYKYGGKIPTENDKDNDEEVEEQDYDEDVPSPSYAPAYETKSAYND